ncbi:MAG: hypothetical protein JOZ66_16885, partial [Hyphomicrobiales bacterium]|nr:hypothetical protein [Hyphomicrobiales bacterium]
MGLRNTSIRGVDLDDFARQLREFQKSSGVGESEYSQIEKTKKGGGKLPRCDRENARDRSTPTSPVHPRQKSARKSTSKVNIDEVEQQLREAAFLTNRRSSLPPKKGGGGQREKPPGTTSGRPQRADAEAASGVPVAQLGLLKASWRPVILKKYGELSVWERCARSLALPLLIITLGTGAFVVLGPEGALTSIDHLLTEGAANPAKHDRQAPVQSVIAAAGPVDRRNFLPSSGGEVGSDDLTTPGVSTTLPADTAFQSPDKVASPSQTANPIEPKTPLNSGPVAEAPAPELADQTMPQASVTRPDAATSPTPEAVMASRITEPKASSSGSEGAVSEIPATALANTVMPTASPLDAGDSAASLSLPEKSIEPGTGSNGDAVFASTAPVVAGLAMPEPSVSPPSASPATTLTPTSEAPTSSSFAPDTSSARNPSSPSEAVSEPPASVLAALPPAELPASAPTIPRAQSPESAASSDAATSIGAETRSNREANSERPTLPDLPPPHSFRLASEETIVDSPREVFSRVSASVLGELARLELPKALTILTALPISDVPAQTTVEIVASTASSTPSDAESHPGSPDRADSRTVATEQIVSQADSSATPSAAPAQPPLSPGPVAASPTSDGAALNAENVAGEKPIGSKPGGETVSDKT